MEKITSRNISVFIINGSVREGGNTDAITAAFASGARSAGFTVSELKLREKALLNCDGCCKCAEGICPLSDDMEEVRAAMETADILVFASPIYWCGVTGLMKTFLDRLFFYYHPLNKKHLSGKKAFILTPMNQNEVREETFILEKTYRIVLRCIGVPVAGIAFFPGLMEKDAARQQAGCLEKARKTGEALAELQEYQR